MITELTGFVQMASPSDWPPKLEKPRLRRKWQRSEMLEKTIAFETKWCVILKMIPFSLQNYMVLWHLIALQFDDAFENNGFRQMSLILYRGLGLTSPRAGLRLPPRPTEDRNSRTACSYSFISSSLESNNFRLNNSQSNHYKTINDWWHINLK